MKNRQANTIMRSGVLNALRRLCYIAAIIGCLICVVDAKCAYSSDETKGRLPGAALDTIEWVAYHDSIGGIEFRYPAHFMDVTQTGGKLFIRHSIPCVHQAPCHFNDEPVGPLSELTDFSVTVQFVPYELASAIAHGAFLAAEMPEIVKPGHLQAVKAGSLLGYRSYIGVEGCGHYTHYFPWTDSTTLVVVRDQITELSPIIVNYQTYLQLPGVIVPEQEESLFYQILATFKQWHP